MTCIVYIIHIADHMTGMKIAVDSYIHKWICQKLLPFAQTYRTGVRISQYAITSEMDADPLDLLLHSVCS